MLRKWSNISMKLASALSSKAALIWSKRSDAVIINAGSPRSIRRLAIAAARYVLPLPLGPAIVNHPLG